MINNRSLLEARTQEKYGLSAVQYMNVRMGYSYNKIYWRLSGRTPFTQGELAFFYKDLLRDRPQDFEEIFCNCYCTNPKEPVKEE